MPRTTSIIAMLQAVTRPLRLFPVLFRVELLQIPALLLREWELICAVDIPPLLIQLATGQNRYPAGLVTAPVLYLAFLQVIRQSEEQAITPVTQMLQATNGRFWEQTNLSVARIQTSVHGIGLLTLKSIL